MNGTQTWVAEIAKAITRLNWHYGKGDVSNVRLFGDGRITFDQTIFGGSPRGKQGRIQGNTVFALGHQKTIVR